MLAQVHVATILITILALATPVLSRPHTKPLSTITTNTTPFHIQAVPPPQQHTANFSSLYLSTFHTGAGTNAVVATPFRSLLVQLTNGKLIYHVPQFPEPYTLGLREGLPQGSTAPQGYGYVSFDVTDGGTAGFRLRKGWVVLEGALDLCAFSLCEVDQVAGSDAIGPDLELLWSESEVRRGEGACVDVRLRAVFA